MEAGLVNIGVGLVLVCVGAVCLVVYSFRASSSGVKGWKTRALTAGLILVANFPAAAALTLAASYILSAYLVVVENRSSWPLENLSFRSPGGEYAFGATPSKNRREQTFHFAGEGAVTYAAVLDGVPRHGIVDGYISSGIGGKVTLLVTENGDIEVRNERF
jgi:hypothetical protein